MTARVVLASVGLLGIFAFLVIAELGINAGLIHYGVKIGHVDVGGLSPVAAERLLDQVGEAMDVGRTGGLSRSLADRLRSWTRGVELGWGPANRVDARSVAEAVAEEAESAGLNVDVQKLESRMLKATWDWPRRPFYEIPFES